MTDGTKWEVLNVFQTDIVNKVIFIVYSGADYQYLANIVLEKMNVVIPELDIVDGKPMAFFIVQEGSGSYTVVHKQINKNQYVEELLKVYLNCHPELERKIQLRLADRKQVWKKMWCNGNLPGTIPPGYSPGRYILALTRLRPPVRICIIVYDVGFTIRIEWEKAMAFSLLADVEVRSILDLSPEWFRERGIRLMLLDFDNTLAPDHYTEPIDYSYEMVKKMQDAGFSLCLVSNAKSDRSKKIAEMLKIPGVSYANKPGTSGVLKAMDLLGAEKGNTLMIGDQLFTDVAAGNRAGLFTIFVERYSKKEVFYVVLKRFPEWIIRKICRF